MTEDEFQSVSEQIREIDEGLVEWDYRGESAEVRLSYLHQVIVKLMEASVATADDEEDERVKLAALEYLAR